MNKLESTYEMNNNKLRSIYEIGDKVYRVPSEASYEVKIEGVDADVVAGIADDINKAIASAIETITADYGVELTHTTIWRVREW